MYKNYLKRFFDFSLGLFAFLVLFPFTFTTFLFLLVANRGDVFFTQTRPGKDEKLFEIIKFKTMNDKKDKNGNLLPDEERLTKVGQIVRKTSLDEMPQLLNVIKGDMSLIGPRPLLPQYLSLYNEEQRKRHQVRPGMTGWAQVNGRNNVTWEDKFKLDAYYVENLSLGLDAKIVYLTLKKVFKSEGVSMDGQATTERFMGNK